MNEVKWGIIGCGDVTEVKSGPAFNKIANSHLCMVMRRNEDKLIDYANRHKVKKYSTNYLELLTDEEINAVYIATPPNMHCFYTIEAAKHKKNVYVEKPMATNAEDCRKMIEACKKNGVKLYVAYYRRGQNKFKAIKEIVDSHEIGKLVSFNYLYTCKAPVFNPERAWLLDKNLAGEGLLFDIGSHMIDIMQFIFGEFDYVHGISHKQSDNPDISEIISGVIRFKNSVQGCLNLSFNSYENKDEFIIVGSKGSISFSVMSKNEIALLSNGSKRIIQFEPLEHVQMPYISEVVSDLLGNNILDSDGIYGLKTQEVLDVFSAGKSKQF